MNNSYNIDATTVAELNKIAFDLDISLDEIQLNIGGERTSHSPNKFVLTGVLNKNQTKIVIKCSKHFEGINEIIDEHNVRRALTGLTFTEQELLMGPELFFGKKFGYTISITEFIEQSKVFTDHTLEEQFFIALHALECQESFHATTSEHFSAIRKKFKRHSPEFYLKDYQKMQTKLEQNEQIDKSLVAAGYKLLEDNFNLLKLYDGYLIHSDLVPHNFRLNQNQLFLLDFVSFRIGNKYESWARLINFMEIHSPDLMQLLLNYVKSDRGEKEYLLLRLMRIYKICFLLNFYNQTLNKTSGDLNSLNQARIYFWQEVLRTVIADQPLEKGTLNSYYESRNQLRSPEEKARQKQFTWS